MEDLRQRLQRLRARMDKRALDLKREVQEAVKVAGQEMSNAQVALEADNTDTSVALSMLMSAQQRLNVSIDKLGDYASARQDASAIAEAQEAVPDEEPALTEPES